MISTGTTLPTTRLHFCRHFGIYLLLLLLLRDSSLNCPTALRVTLISAGVVVVVSAAAAVSLSLITAIDW